MERASATAIHTRTHTHTDKQRYREREKGMGRKTLALTEVSVSSDELFPGQTGLRLQGVDVLCETPQPDAFLVQ